MKEHFKTKIKHILQHPLTQKTFISMKPEKSFLGIVGVMFFFLLPEGIAYFYAPEITHYAKESLTLSSSFLETSVYEMLIMAFEEGVSWLNVGIGSVLLVWLFV